MASGYWSPIGMSWVDGPTLTAAAAASCLPVTALQTLTPNAIVQGTRFRVYAAGRCSFAATTPGTIRLDLRLGGSVFFDTGALPLKTTVTTTLPWVIDIDGHWRVAGASGTFFGFYRLTTEALLGGLASTVGATGLEVGSGVGTSPETAPAVGVNTINTTVANAMDFFYTNTVATYSWTCHDFLSEGLSPLGQ